eukprot:1169730-Prorocentrum_minimum.AAC.4
MENRCTSSAFVDSVFQKRKRKLAWGDGAGNTAPEGSRNPHAAANPFSLHLAGQGKGAAGGKASLKARDPEEKTL